MTPLSPRALATARSRLARAAQLAATAVKRCPRCSLSLPASAFGAHSGRPDGLQAICRSCRASGSAIRPIVTENLSPIDRA